MRGGPRLISFKRLILGLKFFTKLGFRGFLLVVVYLVKLALLLAFAGAIGYVVSLACGSTVGVLAFLFFAVLTSERMNWRLY